MPAIVVSSNAVTITGVLSSPVHRCAEDIEPWVARSTGWNDRMLMAFRIVTLIRGEHDLVVPPQLLEVGACVSGRVAGDLAMQRPRDGVEHRFC